MKRFVLAACLAALTVSTASVAPAHAGTGDQTWLVRNNTTDPVWGRWEVQQSDRSSHIDWPENAPLKPGADASTVQHNPWPWNGHYMYWMARLCFRGTIRGLERTQAETEVFLLGNNGNELYAVYQVSGGVHTVILNDTHEKCPPLYKS